MHEVTIVVLNSGEGAKVVPSVSGQRDSKIPIGIGLVWEPSHDFGSGWVREIFEVRACVNSGDGGESRATTSKSFNLVFVCGA